MKLYENGKKWSGVFWCEHCQRDTMWLRGWCMVCDNDDG